MRPLYLSLVILAMAVIGLVLLAPRAIDGAIVEAQLRKLVRTSTGSEIEVRGPVTLELLPSPRLILGDVTAGQGAKSGLRVDRIELEVGLRALLGAGVTIRRVRLVQPHLRLEANDLVAARELALRLAHRGDLRAMGGLSVVGGVVELMDGSVILRRVADLDLDLSQHQDLRRFDLQADATLDDAPLGLRVETGTLVPDQPLLVTLEATAGPGAGTVRLGYSGQVELAPSAGLDGRLTLDTSEVAELAPLLARLMGRPAPPPLPSLGAATMAAEVRLGPNALTLEQITGTAHAIGFEGSTVLARGGPQHLDAALRIGDLRLDEALLEAAAEMHGVVPWLGQMAGRLAVEIDSLAWRDQAARRVQFAARLPADGSLTLERLSASLPGDGVFELAGKVGPEPPSFKGAIALSTTDLRGLMGWIGIEPPPVLPRDALRIADGTADIDLVPGRATLRTADLRLDASVVKGAVTLALGDRPRLTMAADVDRLDFATYLADRARVREAIDAAATAIDTTLDLRIERASWDARRAGRLHLRGTTEGHAVALEELTVADLGGASLHATAKGRLDDPHAQGRIELAMPSPAGFLRFLELSPPPGLDLLAPAKLTAELQPEGEASALEVELSGTGSHLRVGGTLAPLAGAERTDLAWEASFDSLARLFEGLGAVVIEPAILNSPVRAGGRFGQDGSVREITVAATIGPSALDGSLALETAQKRPRLSGTIKVPRLLVRQAGAGFEALALPLGVPDGNPARWPGRWPAQPLAWRWLEAVDLDLGIELGELVAQGGGLGGGSIGLGLEQGRLAVDPLDLPLAGGRLRGTVSLDHGLADAVRLAGDLTLTGAEAGQVLGLLDLPPGLDGTLDLSLSAHGQGRSIAGLLGSLDGEAWVHLGEGRLGNAAAGALPTDGVRLGGPISIARGIASARASSLRLGLPEGQGGIDLELDLLAWLADIRLRPDPGAPLPFASRYLGPLGALIPIPP